MGRSISVALTLFFVSLLAALSQCLPYNEATPKLCPERDCESLELQSTIMAHQPDPSRGTCPLNHLHFHGFSWKNSKANLAGQPLVLIFDHDSQNSQLPIDKVWVAKLVKCFLQKERNQTVFSDKNLAFQTYKKVMIFNAPRGHSILYKNEDALWTAIHRAH
jgi:hypothetical protein